MMDGELSDDEAEVLLARLKQDSASRQEWLNYHLIGDVLRQPDYIPMDMGKAFIERLQAEPIVFAPQRKSRIKAGIFAVSAVASGMAVVVMVWIGMQVDSGMRLKESRPQFVSAHDVEKSSNSGVNDYLLAHHEFSPTTDVRGASSYIRTVANQQNSVRR